MTGGLDDDEGIDEDGTGPPAVTRNSEALEDDPCVNAGGKGMSFSLFSYRDLSGLRVTSSEEGANGSDDEMGWTPRERERAISMALAIMESS